MDAGHAAVPLLRTSIAPTGQTSMQARQSVHRLSTVAGRLAAGRRARSGQVAMHAPQPVQATEMEIEAAALIPPAGG
jgi:hypothetical protein